MPAHETKPLRGHRGCSYCSAKRASELPIGTNKGKTVLCIDIPNQREPVFYYDGRPYVRDDRMSRRATPEEVKQLVWRHPSAEFRREFERLHLRDLEAM